MFYYRYQDKTSKEGIIQIAYGSKSPKPEYEDLIFNTTWIFEDRLPAPNVRIPDGSRFWFTEAGLRAFRKSLKKLVEILKDYEIADIEVIRVEGLDPSTIIYKDTYQVCTYERKEQNGT